MKFPCNFLLLMALFAGAASAADSLSSAEALHVLARMTQAAAETSFQGVYVQRHGEYLENIKICHIVDAGLVSERREMLDGPPREMVRHGDQVRVYLPKGTRLKGFDPRSNGRLFPRLLPDNTAEILDNYTVRRSGTERVAGLNAEIFDLEPRDALRYAHRLWVHMDSGLLLKAATLGLKREIFDLYAFSQVQIGGSIDRNLLKPVYPVSLLNEPVIEGGRPSFSQWEMDAIPSGFHLVQQAGRSLPGRSQPVLHHLYSDGMTTLSVFIEPMQANSTLGAVRQNALSIFSWQVGSYHITALGEVPPETVEQIAKAYRVSDKQVRK